MTLLLILIQVLDDSGYISVHQLGFPFIIGMIETRFRSGYLAEHRHANVRGSVYGSAAQAPMGCLRRA